MIELNPEKMLFSLVSFSFTLEYIWISPEGSKHLIIFLIDNDFILEYLLYSFYRKTQNWILEYWIFIKKKKYL